MTIYTNSGLSVDIESASAAAKTITAITKAAPGVITSVAHGFSDGDVVLLEILGMSQLDGTPHVVVNSTADTFQLRNKDAGTTGIDTTDYDDFTSGTATKKTLGISITTVQESAASGGDPIFLDTTTIHDKKGKQVIVGSNPISKTFTLQWDPSQSGHKELEHASDIGDQRVIRFRWPNGRYEMFSGSIGASGASGGATQGVTTTTAAVSVAGKISTGII